MRRWRIGILSCVAVAAIAGVAFAQDYIILAIGLTNGRRLWAGDGNWYAGADKTECGLTVQAMAGISTTTRQSCDCFPIPCICSNEYVDKVVCSGIPSVTINQNVGATLVFGGQNDRRDLSWGDWAPGIYKGECGATEVMTGIALNPNVQQFGFGVMGARCSQASIRGATSCTTIDFRDNSVQEQPQIVPGDWDYGFLKGQCGQGRYMKGLAHNGHGGRPLAILCCSPLL